MAPDATPGEQLRQGGRVALHGVHKQFGGDDGVVAVTDIELDIEPGEFVVLLGPSGCGKTTLLRIIGGLEGPSRGTVSVTTADGSPGEVAVAFQDPRLFPWLSVAENVALPLRLKRVAASVRRSRAEALCRMVGLEGFGAVRPTTLSGGMKQRAAIARALSVDPSTLLLDEPFGALDAMTRDQLNLELQRIWLETGATIVLVTHSIVEAAFLGDRIVLLSPRPGRVHRQYQIPFDRPRPIDLQSTPEFQDIVREIRHELNGFEGA